MQLRQPLRLPMPPRLLLLLLLLPPLATTGRAIRASPCKGVYEAA
jgi:hypothetical protein